MSQAKNGRLKIVDDVESIFNAVNKANKSNKRNIQDNLLKSISDKLSRTIETDSDDSSNAIFLKDHVVKGLVELFDQSQKVIGALALQCLSAAVENKYVQHPIDLTEFVETKLKERPDCPNELILLLLSLLKTYNDETMGRVASWLPLVTEYGIRGSDTTRDAAIELLMWLGKHQKPGFNFMTVVGEGFIEKIIDEMIQLSKKRVEQQMLSLWSALIVLMPKAVRNNNALLNSLLNVFSFTMKSRTDENRIASFAAWRTLVDVFAMDKGKLFARNRVKLVMTPYLHYISDSPSENLVNAKVESWWYYMNCLDDRLEEYFTGVVVPLLRYCVGGSCERISTSANSNTGFTTPDEKRGDTSFVPRSPGTPDAPVLHFDDDVDDSLIQGKVVYPAIDYMQKFIGEIILKILCGCSVKISAPLLAPLRVPCCTRLETFESYSVLFIQCLEIWIGIADTDSEDTKTMLKACWSAIFKGLASAKDKFPPERFETYSQALNGQTELFIEATKLDSSVAKFVRDAYDHAIGNARAKPTAIESSGQQTPTRKSIMKPPTIMGAEGGSESGGSSNGTGGIILPREFSPASTPSAGILKRRRQHLFESNAEAGSKASPSPDTRRHVHFNESALDCLSSDDEDEQQSAQTTPRKKLRSATGLNENILRSTAVIQTPRQFQSRTLLMVQLAQNIASKESSTISSSSSVLPTESKTPPTSTEPKESPVSMECEEPLAPTEMNGCAALTTESNDQEALVITPEEPIAAEEAISSTPAAVVVNEVEVSDAVNKNKMEMECQTDEELPMEILARSLSSLQKPEVIARIPAGDLRDVSKKLMSSLMIIFDRLDSTE